MRILQILRINIFPAGTGPMMKSIGIYKREIATGQMADKSAGTGEQRMNLTEAFLMKMSRKMSPRANMTGCTMIMKMRAMKRQKTSRTTMRILMMNLRMCMTSTMNLTGKKMKKR